MCTKLNTPRGCGLIETATILLIVACICVGVTSSVVATWALRSRLYSLEDRVNVVEGVTQREVKIRAATARLTRPSKDEELIEAALRASAPAKSLNWWETAQGKKGAHSG